MGEIIIISHFIVIDIEKNHMAFDDGCSYGQGLAGSSRESKLFKYRYRYRYRGLSNYFTCLFISKYMEYDFIQLYFKPWLFFLEIILNSLLFVDKTRRRYNLELRKRICLVKRVQ